MSIRVFGKNNNQLFKNKSKPTYSMPQKFPNLPRIRKCACGFDYIALITQDNNLAFLYQANIYYLPNFPKIIDVCTSDSTVIFLADNGELLLWEFDYEKLIERNVKPTKIALQMEDGDTIIQIEMGYLDIFLVSYEGKVYHFSKNQWYETNTYSQISCITLSTKIVQVSSGEKNNLFLTYEGKLFFSFKDQPLQLKPINSPQRFIKISASSSSAAISKKGQLYVWGKSFFNESNQPTLFSKLAKKFVNIKITKQNGFALTDDGQIWVWGLNRNGQLGLSDYEPRNKPFPVINLQHSTVYDVYLGDSFTCVLCSENNKQSERVEVREKKVSEISIFPAEISAKKQNFSASKKKRRNSSMSLEKFNKKLNLKNIRNKSKSNFSGPKSAISTGKSVQKKNNFQQKSQRKQLNYQDSKSLRREEKSFKKLEENKNEQYLKIISGLKMENTELKQKIQEQNQLISDITQKIRLLEEAIDEHEQNLTARDQAVEEHELKQQQYQAHIADLQKTIQALIKGNQKSQEVTIIYEDMKTNFEKQRQYYVNKIQSYQAKLHEQQSYHQKQIDKLRKSMEVRQFQPPQNFPSPLSGKFQEKMPLCTVDRNLSGNSEVDENRMDQMINRIENNKKRISKSANKLIAMLDMSN